MGSRRRTTWPHVPCGKVQTMHLCIDLRHSRLVNPYPMFLACTIVASASGLVYGWGTPSWNWGSAVGGAHDAAAELRARLNSRAARAQFLVDLEVRTG